MKKMMEVMVFGGMTVVNPEVRKLFRLFFLEILPSGLSKQFLRFLNEVGEWGGVERSRRRGSTGVSGCLCLTSCCCARLTCVRCCGWIRRCVISRRCVSWWMCWVTLRVIR